MSRLYDALAAHARQKPAQPALVGSRNTYTYAQLLPLLAERRRQLESQQVKVLGLQLANGPDWVLWDIAALLAGVVCIPIPMFFTPPQRAHVIAQAGVDTIVTESGFEKYSTARAAQIPAGTAKITFTSGTTGLPKGVCLPATALEQVAASLVEAVGADYAGRHLSVMPLAILLENIAGVYTALLAGATVELPDPAAIGMANPFQPDMAKLAAYINAQQISSVILVPELLRGLIKTASLMQPQMPSLRFVAVGGSKVSPALLYAARQLGIPAYEGYGLSECASVVALNTPSSDHTGVVGKVLPHIQLEIEGGEVIINNPPFLGYLGEVRAPDARFATGDLGALGEGRVLEINGRKKNILITSQGRNISPEWVESVCLTRPEIAQVVVYGDNLPVPAALVVPTTPGADVAQAIAQVNQALPAYARIGSFQLIEPLTVQSGLLTATGRPRRTQIFARYEPIMTKEESDVVL